MCKIELSGCYGYAALLARREIISVIAVSNCRPLLHVMGLKLIKTKNVNITGTCADATVTYL